MIPRSYVLALVLLLQTSFSFAADKPKKVDVLFVLYDAGETLALQPVMEQLDQTDISYRVLAVATAHTLSKNHPHSLDSKQDCRIKARIDATHWQRDTSLGDDDLEYAETCVTPRLVITGMASRFQEQLAERFQKNKITTAGYYDALSPMTRDAVGCTMTDKLSEVLVSSKKITESIRACSSSVRITVIGQPTLDTWQEALANTNIAALRTTLKLKKEWPTILYAGGYGEDYAEAFTLFAQAAKKLSDMNLLVSLHPKSDGALEKRILRKRRPSFLTERVKILPKTISTMQAATIADVIVTWRSTVGVQALFMGKPVIYLDVPGSSFTNIALDQKWSRKVSTPEDFQTALHKQLRRRKQKVDNAFEQAGVPEHGAAVMSDWIQQTLKRNYHFSLPL
ncbi:MAG: hypothetical protein HY465_02800 [Deltaproteobacteria bacterium]|nr:hypothetical protein [Deltaproteobacteria bacterium]